MKNLFIALMVSLILSVGLIGCAPDPREGVSESATIFNGEDGSIVIVEENNAKLYDDSYTLLWEGEYRSDLPMQMYDTLGVGLPFETTGGKYQNYNEFVDVCIKETTGVVSIPIFVSENPQTMEIITALPEQEK